MGEIHMIEFTGEYKLINHLQQQDLKANAVSLSVNKKGEEHYEITGYLYDRETSSFPVGERFKINIKWGNKEDAENSIRRIRQAISGDVE